MPQLEIEERGPVQLVALDNFGADSRLHGRDYCEVAAAAWDDPAYLEQVDGQFALAAVKGGELVLARTLGVPARFLAFNDPQAGTYILLSERIDRIKAEHDRICSERGIRSAFDPAYTRMPPAHYLTRVPLSATNQPSYERFFLREPPEPLPADPALAGQQYAQALYAEVLKELAQIPADEPVGVALSGGIDSGAVLLCLAKAFEETGRPLRGLRAFTLAIDGGGTDLKKARGLAHRLEARDRAYQGFWQPLTVPSDELPSIEECVALLEDYKPADLECARVSLPFLRAVRKAAPDLRRLFDGDGGDENLLDYPLRDPRYPTIPLRDALDNPLLFTEGRPPGSRSFSLTYSSGLSRSYVRTFAPGKALDFIGISPYTNRPVIAVAAAIPFASLAATEADLGALKERIVPSAVSALTGIELPAYHKVRMQEGCMRRKTFRKQVSGLDKNALKQMHLRRYFGGPG